MGSLAQTVSHPGPSHFGVSMAFLAFFVTSLERAAIHTWRVNGGGRRLDPLDAGPRLPLSPSVPARRTDPVHSRCPTFCVNASQSHHRHPERGDHDTTTRHIVCRWLKRSGHFGEGGFVQHFQTSANSAEDWQPPARHPTCVGSESNSICSR